MNFKITGGRFYGALIVALSAWILQSFLLPLLVACVTAIASWPLYRGFVARLPQRMPRSATSLIFTSVITVFVLAPLMFAVGALLAEAHALLLEIAAADKKGIAVPHWVENVPLVGPWVAARWQSELAHPGAGKRSKRGVRVGSWPRHQASNAAASPTNRGASSRKRSGALAGRT